MVGLRVNDHASVTVTSYEHALGAIALLQITRHIEQAGIDYPKLGLRRAEGAAAGSEYTATLTGYFDAFGNIDHRRQVVEHPRDHTALSTQTHECDL
jgi:hypothetical protein